MDSCLKQEQPVKQSRTGLSRRWPGDGFHRSVGDSFESTVSFPSDKLQIKEIPLVTIPLYFLQGKADPTISQVYWGGGEGWGGLCRMIKAPSFSSFLSKYCAILKASQALQYVILP